MKKYLLISFAALTAMVGCSKVENENAGQDTPENPDEGTFIASQQVISASSKATKTTLDGTSVLWEADDAVTLFAEEGSPVKYILSAGENTTSGTFTADTDNLPAHTSGYAVYPATDNSLVDDAVSVTIADRQTYSATGFPTAYPMAAKSTDGKNYSFDNLATVVNIPLQGEGITVKSIVLETLGGEKIAGESVIRFGLRTPSLSASGSAVSSITLDCGTDGVTLGEGNTVFSFVVIPDVYSGFKITVQQADGPDIVRTSSAEIALEEGTIANLPEIQLKGWRISGEAIGETYADFSGSTRFISLKNQTVTAGTFTVSDPDGTEYSCASDITVNFANRLQAGTGSASLTAGTYDLYIDTKYMCLFVMETGKGPFVVQGEGNKEWGAAGPLTEADMTLTDNGLFVAKDVQFQNEAAFKITATRNGMPWVDLSSSYEVVATAWADITIGTAVSVKDKAETSDGSGFYHSASVGPFDIWFDPDNMLVWIMNPGETPDTPVAE